MHDTTLALAVLLGAGFVVAKLGQRLNLPSVTGYICAGVLLGPVGFDLLGDAVQKGQLAHFTQIALMMIAFGIGEHLEIERLRPLARSVLVIAGVETAAAFVLVGMGCAIVAGLSQVGDPAWRLPDYVMLGVLLGAIAIATAPAATLHVMRELKAAGPLTSTLMAVVAANNGLAIGTFGITVSLVHQLVDGGSMAAAMAFGVTEILFSLILGTALGWLLDVIVYRLEKSEEMLTVSLALLLLGGELGRLFQLSPLLAGMAAGFVVVNRDRRDVRVFRTINAFEPPIFVLFFTLAGAHLHLDALLAAGWVGMTYYLLRGAGKLLGANLGARAAGALPAVRDNVGLALLPQAGVAIGLVSFVQSDASLATFSNVVTPVVLAGVVLSELIGPTFARLAVTRAGEAATDHQAGPEERSGSVSSEVEYRLPPWSWDRLPLPHTPNGAVVFGIGHPATAAGLARMATLLAHYHGAQPVAVRVSPREQEEAAEPRVPDPFTAADTEVRRLGGRLTARAVSAPSVAAGLLAAAAEQPTWALLLGHPLEKTPQEFQRVVEHVVREAACPVVIARLAGVLRTDRILVPVADDGDLARVAEVVQALDHVGHHAVTLLRLVAGEPHAGVVARQREMLVDWAQVQGLGPNVDFQVAGGDDRLATILAASAKHDLIVMAVRSVWGISRIIRGSLAEDVTQQVRKPILLVHKRI